MEFYGNKLIDLWPTLKVTDNIQVAIKRRLFSRTFIFFLLPYFLVQQFFISFFFFFFFLEQVIFLLVKLFKGINMQTLQVRVHSIIMLYPGGSGRNAHDVCCLSVALSLGQ